jgi:hypothetical protein
MVTFAAEPPAAVTRNGQIEARIDLPEPGNGFYRSTRFDGSGLVGSLKYRFVKINRAWFRALAVWT